MPTWQKIGGFRALVNPAADSPSLRKALARIEELAAAPGATLLQAGRHRTVRLRLDCEGGPIDAVAKFFGRQSPAKDFWDRLHSSKARRTYEASMFLSAAGIGTTPPIACLERWRGPRLLSGVFVSAFVPDATCFKDRLVELWHTHAPYSGFLAAMRAAAKGIRALHDSGCSHGDLGNQNVFFTRGADGDPCGDALFLDLNRSRFGSEPLSARRRALDLARICLPDGFREVFMRIYWGGEPPRAFTLAWRLYYRLFRIHSATRKFRHPFRELDYVLHPQKAPAQAAYPPAREQWVWDAETMRPAPVATRRTLLSLLIPDYRRWLLTYRKPIPAPSCAAHPAAQAQPCAAHPDAQAQPCAAHPDAQAQPCAVLRLSMAEPPATTERKIAAARAMAANGAGVALQILQVPPCFGGETPAEFAARAIAACDFPLRWICLGQGVNSLEWGIRDFASRNALLSAAANLAASRGPNAPRVLAPAVEAPVMQPGCANIAVMLKDDAPYDGLVLVWREGDGDLAAEVAALRAFAPGAPVHLIYDIPSETGLSTSSTFDL